MAKLSTQGGKRKDKVGESQPQNMQKTGQTQIIFKSARPLLSA